MKKIIYFILISTLAVFSVSCKSDFLDTVPPNEVTDEESVVDMKSAKMVLNGVYYMIKGTSSYREYYAANMVYYGDVRGTDVMAADADKRANWVYFLDFVGAIDVENMWYIPYKVIDRANRLMLKMEAGAAVDATDENIKNYVAQCRMARALAHFDLLRVYSKFYDDSALGVPIMLTPASYKDKPARSTVKEVFDEVILPDLEYAITNMASDNGNGYFNKWAAMGLLARVYQYRGMDAKALETAQELITKSPYKLWSNADYVNNWSSDPQSQATSEVLFQIMINSTVDWTDREGIAYLLSAEGYNTMKISKNFYDLINTNYINDVRSKLLVASAKEKDGSATKGLNVWIDKYRAKDDQDLRLANIPLLRLSEIYLIASESAFKTNNFSVAVDMLNAIITRGNPNATQVTTSTISLDRILQERRVELFGEGQRYFDLIRNNREIVRYTDDNNIGWNQLLQPYARSYNRNFYKAILPIPNREIIANPNIAGQQNPEY